jgi:hypothetical protein
VGRVSGQRREMGAETEHLARVSCWRVTATFLGVDGQSRTAAGYNVNSQESGG